MINHDNAYRRVSGFLNTPRLIAFVLAAAVVLSFITVIWTKDTIIRNIHTEAIARLNKYNDDLRKDLNTKRVYTLILANRRVVIEHLRHPDEHFDMNELLLVYNENIGADVSYLLNKDGIAIAASNYKDTTSFVGKRYEFREYFQNAIKGIPYEDIALGTVSKKLGFYRTYPVKDGAEIIGVAVIKFDVDTIMPQVINKKSLLLIADSDEVIFHSSDPRLLYRTMHKLKGSTLQKIQKDKTYSGIELLPLPVIKESEKDGLKFITIRHQGRSKAGDEYTDVQYLAVGTHDPKSVWNVHILVGLSDVGLEIKKNVAYVLLSMLIIYLIGVFIIHKEKSRRAL